MLSITKRFSNNEIADTILKKHVNQMLNKNVLEHTRSLLRIDLLDQQKAKATDEIFPREMTLQERSAAIDRISHAIAQEKIVLISEDDMYILVKSIFETVNSFTELMKKGTILNKKRVISPWLIKNEQEKSYLSMSLFAEDNWDVSVMNFLREEYPDILLNLTSMIKDYLLIPYETPYGLISLIVTKSQFQLLERRDKKEQLKRKELVKESVAL